MPELWIHAQHRESAWYHTRWWNIIATWHPFLWRYSVTTLNSPKLLLQTSVSHVTCFKCWCVLLYLRNMLSVPLLHHCSSFIFFMDFVNWNWNRVTPETPISCLGETFETSGPWWLVSTIKRLAEWSWNNSVVVVCAFTARSYIVCFP